MKKPDPNMFDDLSRMAGGALNVFSAFREQILGDIKTRVDEAAARMDLVPREDFDRLELQVKALQKQIDEMTKPKTTTAAKKTATTKKTTTKKTGKKKA